jgi:hypothetical protein
MPDDSAPPELKMLADMKVRGFDMTRAQPVGCRLDFLPEDARTAAADLILAGYSSVRLDMVGAPAVIATEQMLVTPDSLASFRKRLTTFANLRGANVVAVLIGGGVFPSKDEWKRDASGNASTDQADQLVIDGMFAWDVNLKQEMTFYGGLGFPSGQGARAAAAALMVEGYPEVHVVKADFGQVVEAVMYMTPKLKDIRDLRLNLTKFAESREGTWLGFHVSARAPI